MLKSSGAMGLATLLSRVLGMLREMVYARFMGDGMVASAFFYAFQIPNLFRRLLGEGALSAAFIPMFKEKEVQEGDQAMWQVANATLSALITACSLVVVGLILLATALVNGMTLSLETLLFLKLMRLMAPYVLMVCVAAVMMGMLNARGHFFIPALGATTMNVVMIASVFWLAPRFGEDLVDQVHGLALGILVAGLAQMCFQCPLLYREGFRFRWINPWSHPTVRQLVGRILPGVVGVAAFQINIVLTNAIAFSQGDHVVASFNYATRLMELPQGIFGVSLATFMLPMLAGLAAEKKYGEFQTGLRQGMHYLIFANWIATVLTMVLAEPIVRLLFEGERFGADATARAALALQCLIPGLVSFSLVNILARAFFALGEVHLAMRISVLSLCCNLVFAFFLIPAFKQAGMGLANTLSSLVNLGFLWYAIQRKFPNMKLREMAGPTLTIAGAGLLAGIFTWLSRHWLKGALTDLDKLSQAIHVFLPLGMGLATYLLITYWAKIEACRDILDLLKQRLDR